MNLIHDDVTEHVTFCTSHKLWNSVISKNWDKLIDYGCNKGKTHGDVIINNTINYYKKKCKEYNIECQEEYLYKIISIIMTTQENNFRINLVKSSDDFCHTYDKEDFSINTTTKEHSNSIQTIS